jgi:diguanylate cyclase (GGDEF)-like protein
MLNKVVRLFGHGARQIKCGCVMRNIMGLRFIMVIALPILLASAGVLSMTFNLLNMVSDSADQVERKRHTDVVAHVLLGSLESLGRLARENGHWDDAFAAIYPQVDATWVRGTWGSVNSIRHSYDVAAIVERDTAAPLLVVGEKPEVLGNLPTYLGKSYRSLFDRLPKEGASPALATSFAMTSRGAALVAVSAIVPRDAAQVEPGFLPRYLVLIRYLSPDFLYQIGRSQLVDQIEIVAAGSLTPPKLKMSNAAGDTVFAITWAEGHVGEAATGMARQRAAFTLGFLVLVMGGIAVVCWRLIQSVVGSEELAMHQARHDPLTLLPNRVALRDRLKALHTAKVKSHVVAYIDLDGFKEINDNFGHPVGDQLLIAVGVGIRQLSMAANTVCRLGGDEFAVLFVGDTALEDAGAFSLKLLRFLSAPFDLDGRIAFVGASVGIASSEGAGYGELEILRRADVAMYKAKADGKNRCCVYEPGFDTDRAEAHGIAAELRGLIEQGNFDIAFQPMMSTRDMCISGVEVLARWPQTSKRKVLPARFVAVAESAGLIDGLGELVLERACAAATAWPNLRIAVNISALQLSNPQFVERTLDIVAGYGISPRRLEFEITETSLIRDVDRAKLVFKELQRHGIKVALDDFGTGFSSIGYLRTFNFDRIKIDRSIISKVLSSPAELAIVQGTLLVARGLSAEVTAEGVERPEEVAMLKLAGCTELQGFHFHRPMTAAAFDDVYRWSKGRQDLRVAS